VRELLKQALDAIETRLARIENACESTCPKQAVGEMIAVMREMEEWQVLREALDKPEQQPVGTVQTIHGVTIGYLDKRLPDGAKLYAAPVDCKCNRHPDAPTGSIMDAAAHCLAPHQYEHIKAIAQDEPAAIGRMDEFMNVSCSRHPDAPHGFGRNGSHSAGRYVCQCEGWTPGEAS